MSDRRPASDWELPPANGAAGAPTLSVEGFEGPLDWLLELARAQRIDLTKLSILALVEAFLRALEAGLASGARAELGRWGDWLVVAANIALLRSRLLLPPETAEARTALDEAEALRRQLLGRAAMQSAAKWLENRPLLGRDVFSRAGVNPAGVEHHRALDSTELLRACLVALRVPEHGAPYRPSPPKLWRVADALARIGRMLEQGASEGELAVFLPPIARGAPEREFRCRAAVASTLMAGLELAREGALTLGQPTPWRSIGFERPPLPDPSLEARQQPI